MNALERVFNAFELKEVDRVPVIPQLTYAAALWINWNLNDCIDNVERQFDALINAYKDCKHDGIYAGWEGSFNLIAHAMGAEFKLSTDNPPSVGILPISNSEDLMALINKNRNKNKNGDIHFVNTEGIKTNIELIKKLKSALDDVPILSYLPGPFTYVGVVIGVNKLLINVLRDPEFIKEAMEKFYEFILYVGVEKIRAGADCITIADPSSSSTIISPKNFENFGYPFLKRLISDLKGESKKLGKKEVKFGVHICGNTKPILDLIEKMNLDFFELDSLVPISEAREIMKNTCIIGNISPADLMQKHSSVLMDSYKECLNELKGRGHILSSGCEIAYGTPLENIKKMVLASNNYKI